MADTTNTYLKDITVTPAEDSSVTITGEIPYAALAEHRARALEALGADVEVDGFRKGHVPEAVLVKHIGEMRLLTEMAERALGACYPEIIREHDLDVIGHPQVSITKLAPENPLGFSLTVAVMPEVTLPDYRQIARDTKKDEAVVTDEELTQAIEAVQRQKIAYERMQAKAAAKRDAEASGQTLPTPESVDTEGNDAEAPLPELTDEYVQTLGEFASVEDFKAKFREHLEREKRAEVTGKHRAAITDAIVEQSTIVLPQVLIDAELGQMFGQMQEDLTRANLSMDDYLAHIGKTREELEAEWKPAAEKRAKIQLILNEIAKREHVDAPDEEVAHQTEHLLAEHKDADPERVRIYVTSMLRNEAVMQMLESKSA